MPVTNLSRRSHGLRRRLNGVDNILIAGAATNVAFEIISDFIFCRVGIFFQQCRSGHDHTWRAKTALQTVMVLKGLLDRTEGAIIFRHPFNGRHIRALCLPCKHRARLNSLAIHMNHAGSALTGITTDMGAREI